MEESYFCQIAEKSNLASETEPYKYVGVLQVFDVDQESTRQAVIKPYMQRVERVWSSELNAKHKSKSWATPVFRYYFGILKWSKACLNSLDE